jgi:hypothetical protein
MRIKQGYSSNSLSSFNFVKKFNLDELTDLTKPTVIFGVYNNNDVNVIKSIKSNVVIFWGGVDSNFIHGDGLKYISENNNIRNITCIPNVKNQLNQKGIKCEVIPIWRNGFKLNPLKLGSKIYTYVPSHRKEYYGMDLINNLGINDDLLVADYKVPMNEWIDKIQYHFYSQCFVGLSMSKFAGGGTSIIEMGLCGIKSINNIRPDYPNSLSWITLDDIKSHIENEKLGIGKVNKELAEMCFESLDDKLEWLNIIDNKI